MRLGNVGEIQQGDRSNCGCYGIFCGVGDVGKYHSSMKSGCTEEIALEPDQVC